jgi:hypothetical protein
MMSEPELSSVSIDIRYGKAYVPVKAIFGTGTFVITTPIYVADLTLEGLTDAVEKARSHGHPRPPESAWDDLVGAKSPLLKATKARSWRELYRTGVSYTIYWSGQNQEVRVYMPHPDRPHDPAKHRRVTLPITTPLKEIITLILEDVRSRPELLHPPLEPQKRTRKKNSP